MRMNDGKWQSRVDGEYRQCARCAHIGYGEDAFHPATDEFWPRIHGQLWFGRCLACASELTSRRKGVMPADPLSIASNVVWFHQVLAKRLRAADLSARMAFPAQFQRGHIALTRGCAHG